MSEGVRKYGPQRLAAGSGCTARTSSVLPLVVDERPPHEAAPVEAAAAAQRHVHQPRLVKRRPDVQQRGVAAALVRPVARRRGVQVAEVRVEKPAQGHAALHLEVAVRGVQRQRPAHGVDRGGGAAAPREAHGDARAGGRSSGGRGQRLLRRGAVVRAAVADRAEVCDVEELVRVRAGDGAGGEDGREQCREQRRVGHRAVTLRIAHALAPRSGFWVKWTPRASSLALLCNATRPRLMTAHGSNLRN